MKTTIILLFAILFFGCSKKTIPLFQYNIHSKLSMKYNSADENRSFHESQKVPNNHQSEVLATASATTAIDYYNLAVEKINKIPSEKTLIEPKFEKKKAGKLKQIKAIKQAISEDKPKNEKIGKAASIFGGVTLASFLLGLLVISSSGFGITLFFISAIAANIGLILGLVSLNKSPKNRKGIFGIIIGVLFNIFLIAFLLAIRN